MLPGCQLAAARRCQNLAAFVNHLSPTDRDDGPAGELLSVILLFDVLCFPPFDGPIGEFGKSARDATQHAVVLAAVKDAARR